MPEQESPGWPTTVRFTDNEKAQAIRLVRQLRKELSTEQCTIDRVAVQLGYGVESVRTRVGLADVYPGLTARTTAAKAVRIKSGCEGPLTRTRALRI